MSSIYERPADVGPAEALYWDAFDRLRAGKPNILKRGAAVSQNNVAKEAKRDPSALKKERFPRVIRAIRRWIEEHGANDRPSKRQEQIVGRERARSMKEQLVACKAQRDIALSKLVEADAQILELTIENLRLRSLASNNVTHIPGEKVKPPGATRMGGIDDE